MRKENRRRRNLKWRFYRNMRKHRTNTLELEKQVKALQKAFKERDEHIYTLQLVVLDLQERESQRFLASKTKKEPFIIRVWKKVFKK
ncbi:Uncharacterised protein [Phocoenobacter uteri]|uniref:Uncharacterized protein n=1 Tax=Phocoenobacter uteri TaxID=146806 RepID=A0A379CBL7_9PAST|nr:hypothetical protein [Phocoenobacter uteri]SUB59096.1 Uncharacterised protein [Phocoenobacter uteri]